MQIATPATRATPLQPEMGRPSARKATVPVGVPAAVETVAVSATDWPNVEEPTGLAVSTVVVAAGPATVCVIPGEVLPPWEALPVYTAVMVWTPDGSVLTVQVATPPTDSVENVQAVMVVAPKRNATVPSGAPVGAGVTVAVKVTGEPAAVAATSWVTAVVVAVLATVCTKLLDVLVANDVEPLYTALMVCAPPASALVVQVATPEALSGTLPQPGMVVTPSRNVTLLFGMPLPEVTVAVNVTASPKALVAELPVSTVPVGAGLTVCVRGLELLAAKLPPPR